MWFLFGTFLRDSAFVSDGVWGCLVDATEFDETLNNGYYQYNLAPERRKKEKRKKKKKSAYLFLISLSLSLIVCREGAGEFVLVDPSKCKVLFLFLVKESLLDR